MDANFIILIIAAIVAFVALIVGIVSIILLETKYNNNVPYWLQIMLWLSLIIFVLALVVVAFMAVGVSKKNKKKKMIMEDFEEDEIPYQKKIGKKNKNFLRIQDENFEY